MKLSLHQDKIIIEKYHQGVDFLGYVSFPYHGILRIKTRKRMFINIDKKMNEFKDGKISAKKISQTINSYFGTLKHCDSYKLKIIIIKKYGLIFFQSDKRVC